MNTLKSGHFGWYKLQMCTHYFRGHTEKKGGRGREEERGREGEWGREERGGGGGREEF